MSKSKTYLRNLPIPPKKLRSLLPSIKNLSPMKSLDYLFYSRLKAAKILYQAIKSAINNAKQALKLDANLLKFKTLKVDEGIKLKRYRPGPRGTIRPIKRRRSHLEIVLEPKIGDRSLVKESQLPELAKRSLEKNQISQKKTQILKK